MKTHCRARFLLGLVVGVSTFISPCSPAESARKTQIYCIAADEVIWDYAPGGINHITGKTFGDAENFWVASGPRQVGKVVKKAIYREYTDATFTQLKPRPKEWEHLGFLGPLLRAEVGDTIRVTFKNNLTFPVSMHPHGVFYQKDSEGAVGSTTNSILRLAASRRTSFITRRLPFPRACSSGLRPSAFPVLGGRLILIGMPRDSGVPQGDRKSSTGEE